MNLNSRLTRFRNCKSVDSFRSSRVIPNLVRNCIEGCLKLITAWFDTISRINAQNHSPRAVIELLSSRFTLMALLVAAAVVTPAQSMHRVARLMGHVRAITQAIEVPPRVEHGEIPLQPITKAEQDAQIKEDIDAVLAGIISPLTDVYYNGTLDDLAKFVAASADINADLEATNDTDGKSILVIAVEKAQWDVVRVFADKGASFTAVLTHLIAKRDLTSLRKLLAEDKVKRSIMSHGLPVDRVGITVLMRAVWTYNKEIVKEILSVVDVFHVNTVVTNTNISALGLAASAGITEIVELLLNFPGVKKTVIPLELFLYYTVADEIFEKIIAIASSADLAKYFHGSTIGEKILDLALQHNKWNIVKFFAAKGTDFTWTLKRLLEKQNYTASIVRLITEYGSHIKIDTIYDTQMVVDGRPVLMPGVNALMCAACMGSKEVVEALLKMPGIDVNAKDRMDMSALVWAVYGGNKSVVELLLTVEGIDVDVRSASGANIVQFARTFGRTEIADLLVEFSKKQTHK